MKGMLKKHCVIEAKGFPKYYEQIEHKHYKPKMETIKGEFPLSNEPKEKKKSKRFLYIIEAKGFADWYERDFFETREEAEKELEKLRKEYSGYVYGFVFRIKEKEKVMKENILVLWEYQKKRVCEFYGCSDSDDNQYPDCRGIRPKLCPLGRIQSLFELLNEERQEGE